jgi:ribosomal-protein-alanine N-acetyltransferase
MGAELKGKEGAFVVREFRAEDAAAASEILREARELASWSIQALVEFMPLPGAVALISERAGSPTGFASGRVAADEAEVLNLAVREDCRRQGEGRALVEELLRRFAKSGVSRVFLEVRESNRGAIGFYERMGFRQSGRREDYYRGPSEAALVYAKNELSTQVVPKTS